MIAPAGPGPRVGTRLDELPDSVTEGGLPARRRRHVRVGHRTWALTLAEHPQRVPVGG
jgi:hypothetical protein